MRKKILALILSVFMCLCFAGCGNSSNNQDSNEPPKTDEEPENPNNPNEPEKPGEDNKEGTVDDLVKNFWSESVMTDETVLLVAATDANGNVLSAPQAKLMFDAIEIISVKQYFHENNGGKIKEFENVFKIGQAHITNVYRILKTAVSGKRETMKMTLQNSDNEIPCCIIEIKLLTIQ